MMWHVQVARTVKVQVGHSGGKIKNSDIARLDYLKKKLGKGKSNLVYFAGVNNYIPRNK
jgi:hypothetical protein